MKYSNKTLYLITLIVLVTIGIQVYWNYIQYVNNRNQVIHEIQKILDEITKTYSKQIESKSNVQLNNPTSEAAESMSDSIQLLVKNVLKEMHAKQQLITRGSDNPAISYMVLADSIALSDFNQLLEPELSKRNYHFQYNLAVYRNDKLKGEFGSKLESPQVLTARSQLYPVDSSLMIHLNYPNPVYDSFIKGLTGILLSLVLSGIVVFALFYLLQIIRQQKKLSDIKNDFISNVTHEFKTPIATVSSAIEAIKYFNQEELSNKTKKYLEISEEQLRKLNILVEKVMETSLLESSELQIELKKTDVVKLLMESIEKHQLNTSKNIQFEADIQALEWNLDEFHFENAISNLVDNAIKYGGNEIKVFLHQKSDRVEITVSDNGEGISTEDEIYIFDKFYRSKRLTDVIKGFGIGLYYTKKIIEMHYGRIELKNLNTFLITLWKR